MTRKRISLSLLLINLLAFGYIGFNFFSRQSEITLGVTKKNNNLGDLIEPTVSASSSAFIDLTIPYLRDRTYQSSLAELSKVRSVGSYTSYLTSYQSDGLKINGLLTIPTGEEPDGGWPAVVFIHGYIPPTLYKTQEKYVEYVNYLASRGFVVFKIDLRGHGTSEGEPNGAYYSGDYVIDSLNAYSALQNSNFVNPQRIGLWGHSMAGNVVLRSMVARPEIRAGVIWAGAVYSYEDFQKFGIRDSSYTPPGTATARQRRRQQLFDTYGQFNSTSGFWQQVPPTNYLSAEMGAVQLHHSTSDVVVNVGYSQNLSKILEENGVRQEYLEYASGGHNLTSPAFVSAMKKTVEFYERELAAD